MQMSPLVLDLDPGRILMDTCDLWGDLRGQRIFITGGTGFVGCWLLETLAWANCALGLDVSVVVLTRDVNAFRKRVPHLASYSFISLHGGDVRSFAFPEGRFSHVIHAATEVRARLDRADPLSVFDTIVHGTERTLAFAQNCGARSMLLVSSGAVYGKQPPEVPRISEEYEGAPVTTDPLSAYGEGKRVSELLCAAYHHCYGLDVKFARCFTFAGRYLNPLAGFALTDFVRDALRGGPIVVRGDGTAQRSYLHGADMAVWLWTILLRGLPGQAYNVGSDEPISIGELAHAVAELCEPRPRVEVSETPTAKQPVDRYVPSTTRARDELGLRKTVGLPEALRDTLGWLGQMESAHREGAVAVRDHGQERPGEKALSDTQRPGSQGEAWLTPCM